MNDIRPTIKLSAILIILAASIQQARAQDEDYEVVTVKEYTPTLSDAYKINLLPDMKDTHTVRPDFSYQIHANRVETDYQPKAIGAAKITGEPLTALYPTYVKLGFGNYLSPLGEVYHNNLRSRSTNWGFYLRHHSSHANITNELEKETYGGFMDDAFRLYGKKIYRDFIISANAGLQYNSINYYGYNYKLHEDIEDTELEADSMGRQWLLRFYAQGGIESKATDSNSLAYKLRPRYDFFLDQYDNYQHGILLDAGIKKYLDKGTAGMDAQVKYSKAGMSSTDSLDNSATLFSAQPWYAFPDKEMQLVLGGKIAFYNSEVLEPTNTFFPYARFEFNATDLVIPYAGLEGNIDENNYAGLSLQNPFLRPGTLANPTINSIIVWGGLKGRIGPKLTWNGGMKYTQAENLSYFVVDSTYELQNRFTIEQDNGTVLDIYGQLNYKQENKYSYTLGADFYTYNLENIEHAWHQPGMKIFLSGNYNMQDKILMRGQVMYKGKRYAKYYLPDETAPVGSPRLRSETLTLDGYADVSLGVEYRYTKFLSFYLNLNNILASYYEPWSFYPAHGFNLMGGLTYSM